MWGNTWGAAPTVAAVAVAAAAAATATATATAAYILPRLNLDPTLVDCC